MLALPGLTQTSGCAPGTRMMAVKLKEQAAPAHHNRDTHPCCEQVRDANALIKARERALLAATHSINATKDVMDERIRQATAPIHDLNLQFNNSRDDLASAKSNYEAACNDLDTANEKLNQWITECSQPQPPENCDANKKAAERTATEANATVADAKDERDAAQRLNDEDLERLNDAKQHLKDEETERDHNDQICLQDQDKLLQQKAAAQLALKAETEKCPYICRGTPPPPPTLVRDDVVKVVGSDDGVNFWTVTGRIKSEMTRSLFVDFEPKGGPFDLNGTYSDDEIEWQDHNRWSRRSSPVPTQNAHGSSSIAGLYLEEGLEEKGTLKGWRMISDTGGEYPSTITVIGTVRQPSLRPLNCSTVPSQADSDGFVLPVRLQDDGVNFWVIEGQKKADSGGSITFSMDFSQAGGAGSAERLTPDGLPDTHRDGTCTDGRIEFVWEPTCDTVLRGQIKWIKQSPSA